MPVEKMELLQKMYPDLVIQKDIPLAPYTTLRVGGKADYLLTAEKEETFCGVLRFLKENEIPCLLLGNGSNLLVKDGGFRGAVLRMGKEFGRIERTEDGLYAQAGALMSVLARTACEYSLTGLEFAQGIPGTVGGGAYMNAGAYGGEMAQVISSLRVLAGDKIMDIPADDMQFGYRHTRAMEENWIVLGAHFRLEKGDPRAIEAMMADFAARRKDKQPLEYPSAGSTFKRPEGYFAGALVEQCGLKGFGIGGACVSEKHAGFIVNVNRATCADVEALIAHIQEVVLRETGVSLEPEIRRIRL